MQLSSFYYPSLGFGGPVRLMFDYANWVSENNKHVIIYTGDIHHDYSKISSKNDNNKS